LDVEAVFGVEQFFYTISYAASGYGGGSYAGGEYES
jgi:hypothetical protein